MMYVVRNLGKYHMNSSIHSTDTRYRNHLHRPVAKLSCFQKGVFSSRMIFNSLPSAILE